MSPGWANCNPVECFPGAKEALMLIPDTQLHKDQAGESEVHGHPQVCSILEYVKTLATKNLLMNIHC